MRGVKAYTVTRKGVEADPFAEKWPLWMKRSKIALCGYREQGWSAVDQREGPDKGKTVASGEWGDKLLLHPDGTWSAWPDRTEERREKLRQQLARAGIKLGEQHVD